MCAKKFIYLIIRELCKNRIFLTVQFFDTTVHFLYTLLLSSLHSPPVSVTHSSSFPYSYSLFYTIQSDDFYLYMIQRQWMYGAKAMDIRDESKVKIG